MARRRSPRQPQTARTGSKRTTRLGVREWPQLAARVPAETKALLQAVSAVTGRSIARVVTDAIDAYAAQLPATDRALVRALQARQGRARR